jgi:hypothetical protein
MGVPDLDVDAPTARDLRLQVNGKVVVLQAQAAGEKQHADIRLDVRLAVNPIAVHEAVQDAPQRI